MNQENKTALRNYAIGFGFEVLVAFLVIWSKGFFTDSIAVNIQILSDGFTVSGLMFLFFAGMMFVSGEGALIGVTFVFRNVVLWFVPGGRFRQETYRDYRERKISEAKKSGDHCVSLTGLLFFAIGVVFTVIWYTNFYNIV